MKLKAFTILVLFFSASAAFADYYDLARRQAAEQEAQAQAEEVAKITRWNENMNHDITSAVNKFVSKHRGFRSEPRYTYGKYGYNVQVDGHIETIVFNTHDGYECKADWGLYYNNQSHMQINCIHPDTGRNINVEPSRPKRR